MQKRRKARIAALEVLYQRELTNYPVEKIVQNKLSAGGKDLSDFALRIVDGVKNHNQKIDDMIKKYADNWALDRMPSLDRNIIRISLYEMLYEEDIPCSVSINEAVELAKIYGTGESGKFVNGVLGKIATEINKDKAEINEPK